GQVPNDAAQRVAEKGGRVWRRSEQELRFVHGVVVETVARMIVLFSATCCHGRRVERHELWQKELLAGTERHVHVGGGDVVHQSSSSSSWDDETTKATSKQEAAGSQLVSYHACRASEQQPNEARREPCPLLPLITGVPCE